MELDQIFNIIDLFRGYAHRLQKLHELHAGKVTRTERRSVLCRLRDIHDVFTHRYWVFGPDQLSGFSVFHDDVVFSVRQALDLFHIVIGCAELDEADFSGAHALAGKH